MLTFFRTIQEQRSSGKKKEEPYHEKSQEEPAAYSIGDEVQ